MSVDDSEDIGTIDYLVIEWEGRQPNGAVAPHLLALVDQGLIRILDLTLIHKDEDGAVTELDLARVSEEVTQLSVFQGAPSGLLAEEDRHEAGSVLKPGTTAAILVFENRWSTPFASAVRRSGGQLVASGRIPVQAILAALDAAEAA